MTNESKPKLRGSKSSSSEWKNWKPRRGRRKNEGRNRNPRKPDEKRVQTNIAVRKDYHTRNPIRNKKWKRDVTRMMIQAW